MPCPSALAWALDTPFRRPFKRVTLDRVGIRPGERVLELGPGPGAFTVDAARRVGPEGRLIAVDVQPEMIAHVEARVRVASLDNVETHVRSAYDLPLEDESVDRAFLVAVLPEILDQARALAELRRVLKPGGVLSISEQFVDPDYRFPFETLRTVEAAGFFLEQRYGNFWAYTINFWVPGV
jgi:ubiquinone/menaquinone biosynthesis C-methylase UbiE